MIKLSRHLSNNISVNGMIMFGYTIYLKGENNFFYATFCYETKIVIHQYKNTTQASLWSYVHSFSTLPNSYLSTQQITPNQIRISIADKINI